MIEIIILALVGSAIAGLWDLKTTEVPDPLPIGMAVIGAGYWLVNWLLTGDSNSLITSLIVGTILLSAGLLLYKRGQWGGADAWILGAIGYMIPVYAGELFIVPYLLNFMIVSIVYTVVYSLVIGLLNAAVFKHVAKDFRENAKILVGVPLCAALIILGVSLYFGALLLKILPLVILLVLFWRYAVVIEKRVFRKRIPTSRLKKGDVIENGNWIGLTEQQVRKIRKEKKFVTIKDGMRFVPVFAIALLLTLLYGNLFFVIF